jgi:putative methyltransferase (TIGR04325 family)
MHLHDLVPPILTRLHTRLRSSLSGNAATYPSYAAALSACNSRGYEDDEIARVVFEKTKIYRDALARQPTLKVSSTDAYGLLSLAYGLVADAGPKQSLSVVDFGGACGAHYFAFRKFFAGSLRFNWIVVETRTMCQAAAPLAGGELSFCTDLDQAFRVGPADLLFASGTIQFLAEPYLVLQRMTSSGSRYLLFNRLTLGSRSEDVISIHRSMLSWNGLGPLPPGVQDREVRYPYTLLSKQRFEARLTGYETVVEFEDPSGAPFVPGEVISNVGRLYRLRSSARTSGAVA